MIICGLSSGQTNLHPPIWGHGRQLDDRHRHPNINIREIIWLGNQLGTPPPPLYGRSVAKKLKEKGGTPPQKNKENRRKRRFLPKKHSFWANF